MRLLRAAKAGGIRGHHSAARMVPGGMKAAAQQAALRPFCASSSVVFARGFGAPRMPSLSAEGSRAFSTNLELVLRQADSTMATVAEAEKLVMAANWNDLDAEELDDMAAGIGRGRDLINSLSVEEAKSAEADKGLISAVEAAEARLAAAIKCDELAHEAKDLRMEMEDVGTTGDGDNKPEAFQKQWETRFTKLMNDYTELLENCHASFIGKVERDCGYQLLLLKRVVHVDFFRYAFPKVHPSGFSASSD